MKTFWLFNWFTNKITKTLLILEAYIVVECNVGKKSIPTRHTGWLAQMLSANSMVLIALRS